MIDIPRHTPDNDQPKINALLHELKIAFPHLPEPILYTLAVAGTVLSEEQLQEILTASEQNENKVKHT